MKRRTLLRNATAGRAALSMSPLASHVLFSSDAGLITEIVKRVDRPFYGAISVSGSWCLSAKRGSPGLNAARHGQAWHHMNSYKGSIPER